MISTLTAIARRIRGVVARHTLATWITVALTATAVVVGGALAVTGQAHASGSVSAATSASPSPTPAAKPAKKRHAGNADARELVAVVAKETAQPVAKVVDALKAGKTLNEIAGSHADAVVQMVEAKAKANLDKRVAAGKLTADNETSKLAHLHTQITALMAKPGPEVAASLAPMAGHPGHKASPSPTAAATPAAAA